jgi:hypothetical protein
VNLENAKMTYNLAWRLFILTFGYVIFFTLVLVIDFQLGCLSVWGFDSSQIIFLTGILFLETVDYCKKNIDQLVAGYVSAFYFHQQMIKVLNLMFLTFFFHYNVHLHGVSSLY